MKAPADRTVAFTFVSHPVRDVNMRWAATLTFPPGAGPDDALPVHAENGAGAPLADAVFEFAGAAVKISDGDGTLKYRDFIAGKHEKAIWMRRPGADPVPGSLTFA